MKYFLILSLLSIFFIQCQGNKKELPSAGVAPALTQEDFDKLTVDCDFIDFLFFHLPISVSQNEKASLESSVKFFTVNPVPANMQCPAIGRMSLQSKGKIILDADIHFLNNCAYFTFIRDKKAIGSCLMSQTCPQFLTSLINSVPKEN